MPSLFLKNVFELDFHEMKYAIPLYSVIIIPKMTQIPFYHIDKPICIEYVATNVKNHTTLGRPLVSFIF